jgi:hypothetical protein
MTVEQWISFVVCLTALSVTHDDWMIVNNELERMWKEAVVA